MPKIVSLSARRAFTASRSGDALIGLITIDPVDGGAPIRLCTEGHRLAYDPDRFGIVSRGETFDFLMVRLVLPDDSKDVAPSTSIEVDNIDPAVVEATQLSVYRAEMKLEVVLASEPDEVIEDWPALQIMRAAFTVDAVTLDVSYDPLVAEPFVMLRMTSDVCPALRKQ